MLIKSYLHNIFLDWIESLLVPANTYQKRRSLNSFNLSFKSRKMNKKIFILFECSLKPEFDLTSLFLLSFYIQEPFLPNILHS